MHGTQNIKKKRRQSLNDCEGEIVNELWSFRNKKTYIDYFNNVPVSVNKLNDSQLYNTITKSIFTTQFSAPVS
jgi:hypothetical protein